VRAEWAVELEVGVLVGEEEVRVAWVVELAVA